MQYLTDILGTCGFVYIFFDNENVFVQKCGM